jgi:hypothetical protein
MPLDGIRNPFDEFNTERSPILFPVGERNVGWQQRDGAYRRTPEHKAIIRLNQQGDNAHILNIVGATYKLIHNRELFTAVEDAMLSEMPPDNFTGVMVKDRVAGWGRVCYREYVFPSIRRRLASTVGDIGFRVIVQNGYGGSALRIHAGAIDFYCTNGMIRGEYVSAYKRHTSRLVVGKLNATITHAVSEYTNATEEWQRWAQTPVQHEKAMDLFRKIASSDKMREGLADQYMREQDVRGTNLWAVYSTLTHYASHPEGAFALRKSVEESDTVASTMLRHEMDVARWTRSDEWKVLEDA